MDAIVKEVTGKEKRDFIKDQFTKYYPADHSNIKYIPSDVATVAVRAKGNRIWDMDGTELIDYACGVGPSILGHQHPELMSALHQSLDTTALSISAAFGFTENDTIVAEKLTQHIPCAESVRLAVTGSEAVQSALRIARAHTNRPYVLQFHGHFHGWLDNVSVGIDVSSDDEKERIVEDRSMVETNGIGPGADAGTLLCEWNDIEELERVLTKYGDKIAMIIMEAYASNSGGRVPRPGYLQRVRELCDQYGIVLCFDEVMTGYRLGLSGAQGFYGVTPDLATFGKAMGGGMPISALVGKRSVMDTFRKGKTLCGGTYTAQFLCVQAARTTLEILERNNGEVYEHMEKTQNLLMTGLDEIARRRNIPLRIQGVNGVFSTLFGIDPDKVQYTSEDAIGRDTDLEIQFMRNMKKHGVLMAHGRMFSNITHTEKEVELVLEAADKSMALF